MKNRSNRSGLILAILCGLVFTMGACSRSADQPSQPQKQVSIPDDDLDCDSTCEAQVKVQSISAGRLKVTEAQWQAALASGRASLAHDPEWLELIAEMKEVICQRATDSQEFRDWNERESKKTNDDIFKDGKIGNAIMPGDSPEVDEARAKVAKIQIVRYMYERDRQSCPAPTPKPSAR
jgi:hypothetical protein